MFNPAVIWTPDICHYNGWERSCHITDNPRSNAIVESDGTVLWVPPVRLSSRCDLDRTNWPRDTATCCIKFGSWTYNGHRVNLSMFTSYEVSGHLSHQVRLLDLQQPPGQPVHVHAL
ncbi:acetylcholine receptor subunit beta-like 1 [Pollicipes pollicipes]|uniref:acetylcholine receptor subunit beta-like 1 n=1 Tax=Pollicipes pollicipes TaxID=41117 RepID=UPI001884E0E4|nr:acetylcholine receptor subunit beta-like 1 [Pollicipes pollicipes]